MNSLDILRRAGKSLRQAKIRTLLTSLAIGVGAFTLMLSLAAGQGARDYADKLISSNVDPSSLFIVKDKAINGIPQPQSDLREYNPDTGSAGVGAPNVTLLNNDDIAKLQAKPYLKNVRPIYQFTTSYLTFGARDDKKYTADVNVYNPDVLSEHVTGMKMVRGKDLAANEAVIPESFAKTLGTTSDKLIGQQLSIYISRDPSALSQDKIQSVLATEGIAGLAKLSQTQIKKLDFTIKEVVKPSNLSFTNTASIQISLSAAKGIVDYSSEGTSNYQKYFAATAQVKDGTLPKDAKSKLQSDNLYAQTADDLQGFLFTIVNVLQGIVGGFGVIALIASIFGIVNTQYISVLERTSQIGLMRALGMRGKDVSRLFRYEAAWIGFLGGVIGIAAAWILGTALNPWITKQLDLGASNSLLEFKWLQALGLLAVLILVAVIAGYFPSRKAARLDPIEALRTE